jgi:hypothetical protein
MNGRAARATARMGCSYVKQGTGGGVLIWIRWGLLARPAIRLRMLEDAPGELAFECSEGLLGLAVGLVAGDVGLGGRVGVFRDDRDRVFGLERAEATMDRVSARYAESFGRHRRDRVLD